ncbi:MAG: glycosyltransferase family 39 protein [Hormoscilla sp. SP12CHS1]|nr:glycosyltransferase family 39 protein [Hormoscilla sp. SP12CHS1]
MYSEVFHQEADRLTWSRPINKRTDRLILLALLLTALLLFTINLGELPLRDWDEGTVAQVARNISREPFASSGWLYPTLGDRPYLNKPPLVHWLIAWAYLLGGVNEWTSRLPSALLSALTVPLLYCIGLEIFPKRTPAIFSSLIFLTLLPVVRHGRLAMLDGPVLCFFLLTILCTLRARRDLRYGLGVGIALGLICLTKSILGLLLGAIALLFLFWDTPRLLSSVYLWSGIFLGLLPVTLWYIGLYLQDDGHNFIQTSIIEQSFSRIWQPVENHPGPVWYYLLEILKYAWPWPIFFPRAYRLAWSHRNMSWAKLVLIWSSVYLIAISVMATKLPWYILPLYPAGALASGAMLTEIWHDLPRWHQVPRMSSTATMQPQLLASLVLLALVGWGGFIYFGGFQTPADWNLAIIMAVTALTMTVAAVKVAQASRQFLVILFWGSYVGLLLFFLSGHWIWELAEAYPVKPVAEMIQKETPPGQKIFTNYSYGRPSLDFYSSRQVIPLEPKQLQDRWDDENSQPYLLIDGDAQKPPQLKGVKVLDTAGTRWQLITRDAQE